MNILVIIGHPDQGSFSHALANRFNEKALFLGHSVKIIDISLLNFDPILRKNIHKEPLEEDLVRSQEAIAWSHKLVFFYPIWWGGMPALLKGWIDRVFISGFAFKFKDRFTWKKLLLGKSAHIFTTMDTPIFVYHCLLGEPNVKQMKNGILEFCGISPVTFSEYSPISHSTQEQREEWLKNVETFAESISKRVKK